MNDTRPTERILKIARSFPCLERKLRHWHPPVFDPDKFFEMTSGWSHGELLCAAFVLVVWNPINAHEKGWTFDVAEFAGTATYENRQALMAWLMDPAWP